MLGRIETAVRHQKKGAGSQDRLVLKFYDVAQFASKCVRSSVYVQHKLRPRGEQRRNVSV